MRATCAGVGAISSVQQKTIDSIISQTLAYKVATTILDEKFTISSEEVARRYDVTEDDWAELLQDLGGAGYGDVIACTAASAILNKDYGLSCIDE
jgi:hypothetical protein